MITIEKLIRVSKDVVAMNSFRSVYGWIELVRFAISQHEEIERLRAALQEAAECLWNNSLNTAARKAERALKTGEPSKGDK